MRLTGALLAAIGGGSLWMAWLMRNARLPRNDLAGMRTRATLASDEAWIAAHRASAWSIALTGVLLLAGGIWLLLDRQPPGSHARRLPKAESRDRPFSSALDVLRRPL